jgi:hypothetical protein
LFGAEHHVAGTDELFALLVRIDVDDEFDEFADAEDRQEGHRFGAAAPEHHCLAFRGESLEAGRQRSVIDRYRSANRPARATKLAASPAAPIAAPEELVARGRASSTRYWPSYTRSTSSTSKPARSNA